MATFTLPTTPGTLELLNANRYASYHVTKHYYDTLLRSHPHIFKHTRLQEREATPDDFYIPPKIKDRCKTITLTFTQVGCEKIACYGKKRNLKNCQSNDLPHQIPVGRGFAVACSPACFHFLPDDFAFDTDWRDQRCLLSNPVKKLLAVYPELVHQTDYRKPWHTGLDLRDGQLHVNPSYCASYGLDLSASGDACESSTFQDILELAVGTTVYRTSKAFVDLNVMGLPPRPPPVPHHLRDLNQWSEGVDVRALRSHVTEFEDTPDLPPVDPDQVEVIVELAQNIAFDMGLNITIKQLQHILRTVAPKFLGRLATAASAKVAQSALASVMVHSAFKVSLQGLRTFSTLIKSANVALLVLSLATLALDTYDVGGFLKVLDKYSLERLNEQLDWKFHEFTGQWELEIQPLHVALLLTDGSDQMYELYKVHVKDYLDALENEAFDAMMVIEQERQTRRTAAAAAAQKQPRFERLLDGSWWVRVTGTVILVVLGLLFVEYLHIFLLCYLFLIVAVPHSA